MTAFKTALLGLGVLMALNLPRTTQAEQWKLTSAPHAYWLSVASSADGNKLVAAEAIGLIYTSTNAGATWAVAGAPSTVWNSVASSADGTRLVAVRSAGTSIYLSTNSGATWSEKTIPNRDWAEVASSADGARLVATTGGPLLSSSDFGATWTNYSVPEYPLRIAMCAGGSKLVAEAQGPASPVYVSTNSGATWTATSAINDYPGGVAISADGTRMVAASYTFDMGGPVYTSRDYGATWTTADVPNEYWDSVACSADGTTMAAVGLHAYVSSDSGRTWSLTDYYTGWVSRLASSADGCRLVAASQTKGIYVWETTPQPVLTITPAGYNVLLSWIVPSRPFILQQSSDLASAVWTDVATPPVLNCSNLHHEVTLPAPTGPIFYRLKSQ